MSSPSFNFAKQPSQKICWHGRLIRWVIGMIGEYECDTDLEQVFNSSVSAHIGHSSSSPNDGLETTR